WADDQARRPAAGRPEPVACHPKPWLAFAMIERALAAGVPARWGVGDAGDGSDGQRRRALEARGHASARAVQRTEPPTTGPRYGPPGHVVVAAVAAVVEPEPWQRLSWGDGAQGERRYAWAAGPLRPALADGWLHALMIRRRLADPDEVASSLIDAPTDPRLTAIGQASGARWTIAAGFKLATPRVGLDEAEVRSWTGGHRHTTLALLARAALVLGAVKGGLRRPLARTNPWSPS